MPIKILIITQTKEEAFSFLKQKLRNDYNYYLNKIYNDNSNILLQTDWIVFYWLNPKDMHICNTRMDCIYINNNFKISENTYSAIIKPLTMSYHYFNLKENKDNDE